MFLGITPLRISFAGGGTDMPEYFEINGGSVVTSTISRFIYVIINQRTDNFFQAFSSDLQSHHEATSFDNLKLKYGTEIAVSVIKYLNYTEGTNVMISSDVPPGSGLGASGALAVNLVNSILQLKGETWPKQKIAETAYHIGRNILKWPIGKQDEYATTFGGLNYIEFEKDRVKVNPISMNKASLLELQQNMLLFFVGKTRNSANILSTQIQKTKEKNSDTVKSLDKVKQLAEKMRDSLSNNDITAFGQFLDEGWTAKKKFTSGVTNEFVDSIYEQSLKYGAIGGKLTGAGGGGHLLLYCEIPKQQDLISKLEGQGLRFVTFGFQKEGPKLINLYDFAKDE